MKPFLQFFLEYRHNLADGTPTPSIYADNGRNPNIVGPDKKQLYTKGDREEDILPGIYQGVQLNRILPKLGLEFQPGKVYKNYKNSGNDCYMTMGLTGPMVTIKKGLSPQ